MNGWVISIAVALVLVIAFRAWFRWFSRRPLSTVDHYARVVDTSVDAVDGDVATVPTPAAFPGSAVRRSPVPQFPVPRAPVPHPSVPPSPAGPTATPSWGPIPQQRGSADAPDTATPERPRTPHQQR